MYIIGKRKEYYDYLLSKYGIDKYVVLDRRNSFEREIVCKGLENLVHRRFNMENLKKELSGIFETEVNLYPSESEMVELLGDSCYTFAIGDDFGVFDIYYLPHKCTDENGNDFYVTEVGYSFGC